MTPRSTRLRGRPWGAEGWDQTSFIMEATQTIEPRGRRPSQIGVRSHVVHTGLRSVRGARNPGVRSPSVNAPIVIERSLRGNELIED